VTTFALLVLAALVTTTFPLPWQLGGLAFVAAALVAGAVALRAARRSGVAERVTPMLVVGMVLTVLMGMSMSTTLVLWDAQLTRQRCLDHALTVAARSACEARYEDDVRERLEEITRRSEG
jgi:hypothetical protein